MKNLGPKILLILPISILVILYFLICYSLYVSGFNNQVVGYVSFTKIEYLSILITFILIIFSLYKIEWFFYCLILGILCLPASFNNIIPSILISSENDYTEVYFPLITHLDVILIIGILRYCQSVQENVINLKTILYFVLLIFVVLLVCVINVYRFNNYYDILLTLSHTYHLRYICLTILLFTTTNIIDCFKTFTTIFCLGILLLILESLLYSNYVFITDRLISGNFGNNVYGNLLSGAFCYFSFLIIRRKISYKYVCFLIILFSAIVSTKTRSSLYISIIYLLFEILNSILRKRFSLRVLFSSIVILLIILFTISKDNRTNFLNFSIEKINFNKEKLHEKIILADSPFNKSLSLRLEHLNTSYNMIKKRPYTGIGAGRWNVKKRDFGSTDRNVMDSHNDFFAIISQYGFFAGFLILFNTFLYPFYLYINHRKLVLKSFIVFNSVIFATGISNTGLFKHQLFLLLTMFSLYYIFNVNTLKINIK